VDGSTLMAWPALTDIRAKLGDVSQLVDVRSVRLQDGNEDGTRALVVVSAAGGMQGLVMSDRGMDLGPVSYAGVPLGWIAPVGAVHPSYIGDGTWLRGFHGGLLTGAGLQNVGPDCVDEGESHGLHGRLSTIPARDVHWQVCQHDDATFVEIQGRVREVSVYGADLEMRRRIRWHVGTPRIDFHDQIINRGFDSAGLMVLYHFNIGWPVVDEGSKLIAPPHQAEPYDERAMEAVDEHDVFVAPRAGAVPEVFELVMRDAARTVTAGVCNPHFEPTAGIAVTIEYKPEQLPHLLQWRMMGQGLYLTGIEPSNTPARGRDVERAQGTVAELLPGESRFFDVTVRAAAGDAARALLTGRPPATEEVGADA
jgi:hypothetical protein